MKKNILVFILVLHLSFVELNLLEDLIKNVETVNLDDGLKSFNNFNTSHLIENLSNNPEVCNQLIEFYLNESHHYVSSSHPMCIRLKPTQTIMCMNELEDFKNFTNKPKLERIENIVLCNLSTTELDPKLLQYFTKLKTLILAGDSVLQKISSKFPYLEHLRFINISDTQLRSIKNDTFKNLPSIKKIDLRNNKMYFMERLLFTVPALPDNSLEFEPVELYLQSNAWNCTKNLKWITFDEPKFEIMDRHYLNCTDQKYKGRPMLTVMNYKLILHRSCHENIELRNCTCHISYLRLNDAGTGFHPMYSINCSHAGLQSFPKKLPVNTTALFLSHNNISSLDPICTKHSIYREVYDLHLDYNRISRTEILEHCFWLDNFRVFNLKGNLIDRIPYYAIKNCLARNPHAIKLFLSENNFDCSCKLAPRLQTLLMKYSSIIVDFRNITCLGKDNDIDIYGHSVMELTRADFCKVKDLPYDPYDIASIVLLTLIILLLVNLCYDCYHYKKYGKLPWIAIKMPCF